MKNNLNLLCLILGQGLTGAVISLLTLTSILIGKQLAPTDFLTTLPITSTILGSAIMVFYAALLMKKYGRKKAFIFSGIIGILGALCSILAVYIANFYLFLVSTFILGCATVFNQYYRFAAAEICDDPIFQKKATALVISGGILGGIIGPYLAKIGVHLINETIYLGNFIFVLSLFSLLVFSQLFIDLPTTKTNKISSPSKINYSPSFIFGSLSCILGFSLMTLLMNATPLMMHNQHYSLEQNTQALQLHFIAMYLPALFLPFILNQVKTSYLILIGNCCFICAAISAFLLQQYEGYILILILSGAGWALMFTAGTFYLNQLPAQQKHQLQGISSTFTYLANLIASFSVGILLTLEQGWILTNVIILVLTVLFLLCYPLFKVRYKL